MKNYQEIRLDEDVIIPAGLPEGHMVVTPNVKIAKGTIVRLKKIGKIVVLDKRTTKEIPFIHLSKIYWDFCLKAKHTVVFESNNKINWDYVRTFDDFRLLASSLNLFDLNIKSNHPQYEKIKQFLTIDNDYNEVKEEAKNDPPPPPVYYEIDENKIKTPEDVMRLVKAMKFRFETTSPEVALIADLLMTADTDKVEEPKQLSEAQTEETNSEALNQ